MSSSIHSVDYTSHSDERFSVRQVDLSICTDKGFFSELINVSILVFESIFIFDKGVYLLELSILFHIAEFSRFSVDFPSVIYNGILYNSVNVLSLGVFVGSAS
jgi:hypothetical protein